MSIVLSTFQPTLVAEGFNCHSEEQCIVLQMLHADGVLYLFREMTVYRKFLSPSLGYAFCVELDQFDVVLVL